MSIALEVLSIASGAAWNVWLLSCVVLRFLKTFKREPSRVMLTLRNEIRPFAPIIAVVPFLADVIGGDASRWSWIVVPLNLGVWWIYRNDKDDDDRWKRRKEKLAARVAQVGGRLQVVPVSSS